MRVLTFLVILFSLVGSPVIDAKATTGAPYSGSEDNGTQAVDAPATFNILLGRPTDHSVTANIIPDEAVDLYIQFGTSSGVYTGQTGTVSAVADEPVEILADGLPANDEVFYRIAYQASGASEWAYSPESSFHTQRSPGEGFTFTIISNSHLGQYGGQTADQMRLYAVALENVEGDEPDFHIDLGDTFAMDPSPLGTGMTDAEAKAAYYIQRPYLGEITDEIPFFLAIGNHENEEGWNFDDIFTAPDQSLAKVGLKYRKYYYPNPIEDGFYTGNQDPLPEAIGGDTNREDYYAWEWGDALFVVLDPYHYSDPWPSEGVTYGGEGTDGETQGDRWDWSLGIDQYLWFKETLETSDATYKFVFSHHVTGGNIPYGRGGIEAAPYFEWGGMNADDTWGWDTERPAAEGWDLPIHQLMVANGVNVYFHGHDHIYAYEQLDGIHYVECPKPDDDGYTWQPFGYGYNEGHYPNGLMIPNSGHIRVQVSPEEVTVQYVRSYLPEDENASRVNGQVDHEFTIEGQAAVTHELTMQVDPVGAGATSPPVGPHTYDENEVVSVSASANTGFQFDHWSANVADPNNASTTVTMDEGKTVTAYFTPICYPLTRNHTGEGSDPVANPTNSTGCPLNQYTYNQAIDLSGAVPSTGWHISSWTGTSNNGSTASTNSLVMPANSHTASVVYSRNTVTLTINTAGNGTVTPDPSGPYLYGDSVQLTADADTGWKFDGWSGDLSGTTNPATIILDGNKTVSAQFSEAGVPTLPSSFYGVIHIYDDPPSVGDNVEANVPGVANPATATISDYGGDLVYAINIPGYDGAGAKDGGEEGDMITFMINGRIVATATWHSGTNVELNIHPPQALHGGPYTGTAGVEITFNGSANDWASDTTTYEWDWDNDGTYDTSSQNSRVHLDRV